jgi:AraC family transcriptional regulator, regulatory protein of adaptative response / DNA-3-methyladenine glycosylase II
MSIVAVATTGIYCRAGCPAPAPKATNTGVVPSVEVARAAGYRACKRCHPDREPPAAERADADVFLPYRGRRDLRSLLSFLAARAIPGVEATTANELVRTLRLPRGAGLLVAKVEGSRLRCRVWVEDPRDAADAMERARHLFDLDRDLRTIDADLSADPDLATLMKGRRGKAVPGTVDGFELAVRAILGQQVTVSGARTLATRLVAAFGAPLPERARDLSGGRVTHVFPSPERLAEADVAGIGMPGTRAESIRSLASAVAAEEIDLSDTADPADVRQALTSIRGVGPWTADYVTMRVQRDADAFLSSDLGVRKAMGGLGIHDERRAIEARAERWRPWRAYAQQYLWASLTAG